MSSSRSFVLTFVLIGLVLWSAGRIQSQGAAFKMQVLSAANGLRAQTDLPGGEVASFGGYGHFQVDAPSAPGGRFAVTEGGQVGIGIANPSSRLHVRVPASANPISAMTVDVDSFSTFSNAQASHFFRVRDLGANSPSAFMIRGDGNVGIGTDAPAEKLTVAGTVRSTSGGLRFPDGSVQTTAALAASTYTKTCVVIVGLTNSPQSVCHLSLPSGTYLLASTFQFDNLVNHAEFVVCEFTGESLPIGLSEIPGLATATLTMHSVLPVTSGGVDVNCRATTTLARVLNRRLTATLLNSSVVQ